MNFISRSSTIFFLLGCMIITLASAQGRDSEGKNTKVPNDGYPTTWDFPEQYSLLSKERIAWIEKVRNDEYALAWNYPDRGLLVSQEWIDQARKEKDPLTEAYAYIFKADCYVSLGDFAPAIQSLLQARSICDQHNISVLEQRINRPYGRIYIELGNPTKAIEHHLEALSQVTEEIQIWITRHSLGEAYVEAGQLDKAYDIAIDLYDRGGHLWAALPRLLGNTYLRQNKPEKALAAFQTQSDLTTALSWVGNMNGIAASYLALGQRDSSRVYARKALEMSEERKFIKSIQQSTDLLAQSYRDVDDKQYIFYLEKSHEVNRQMYSPEKMNAFNDLIFSDEISRREMAAAELHFAEQRRTWFLLGLAGLFLLFCLFLWRIIRLKTQSNQLLKAEKEKVEQSMKQLEITQHQLLIAEKTARDMEKQESDRLSEINILKTRMYTNITHEFRTPLSVILGVNDTIEGYTYERSLIRRNANNLLNLINQLLNLSKIDSGTIILNPIRGNIISYLHYLTESFYSMASSKKITLNFDSPLTSMEMDYDEDKIQQIINNQLSNAIKFTKSGGKVGLFVNQVTVDGCDFLEIRVKDTGVGVVKEDLPFIFDRFFQSELQAGMGGTGIGLALTRELVELMHGEIKVQSEPNWGTEFITRLPITQLSTTPGSQIEHQHHLTIEPCEEWLPVSPDQIQGDKPIVLIVEDNEGVIYYMQSILEAKYNLLVAMNGREGIELALQHIPDIILSDVMMPEISGYTLCNTLKSDVRTSHIPIILLTAKADISSRVEGLKHGADAYLSKPFEKDELLVRMEKLLELRAALQEKYANTEMTGHPGVVSENLEDQFLAKFNEIIRQHLDDEAFTVSNLSKLMCMSHTQMYRKVKAITGKTPSNYTRSVRFETAIHLLQNTDLQIQEIAYRVGFSDPNYFTRMFKHDYGRAPGSYRNSAKLIQ